MTRQSRFQGTIGRTLADSQAWFDEPPHPGADAPNVVVVLLDDTGFAQLGCYGSEIDTRHIDALAANGLQFNNFHVTPLCSPTRAALLTTRPGVRVRPVCWRGVFRALSRSNFLLPSDSARSFALIARFAANSAKTLSDESSAS